ncbi:MAG: hypothetical protein R2694_16780 [Ilumatobacteraceae bacterium]|nr:hypothetical protein [Acidimicrobiaceae bacterium]MCO5330895.1 hypothetical protein [Ilumatobacteraceae bacterium]HPQ85419.1 hypothetical protein [Actinomycetota bacterium]
MATFPDLTMYTYGPSDEPMVNVGWLGSEADFERGATYPGVVAALLVLAADQRNLMRGVHYCEFCEEESPIRLPSPVERGWVSLGMGEIHVRGRDGTLYSAPSLVIHYISVHGYRPPDAFQLAVLDAVGGQGIGDAPWE